MVQLFLNIAVLITLMITHWISLLVYPMNLLRWHWLDLKNILTLTKGITLNRGPPQISIQVSPRNLGLPHLDPKSMLIKVNTSEEDQSSAPRHRYSKPSGPLSDQDQPQHDPDPPYYREVALSDVPSQYAEEVDTFILSLPDPRESMLRSSTSVMGLDDEKGRQELRPRGPSSMLPFSSLSKMLLINLSMTFTLLIYLRVNISNLLLPLQSGTRWDSLVMGTRARS